MRDLIKWALAIVIGGAAWAIGSAFREPSNCEAVEKNLVWLGKTVETQRDLEDEINGLIIDNRCDGITPQKLRKVLLDMTRISSK